MSRSALYTEGLANDLTLLDDLSNQGISDCLKARLEHSIIYTYIGSVLVSVNPFQPIDGLYSQERIERYSGSYQHENRPHIFAIAENAYYALRTESHNQCIIITGESGAGKTEASKKIMHYLAAVSSGRSEEVLRVKDQLLKSNPVFEAFGNARTVRNNNSSRFGKYLSIVFDFKADPVGGTTQTYLLEKSRVTSTTSPEERSFHIFYQLTKGASAEQREAFQVRDPSNYRYLSQSGCFDVEHMDDTAEFGATLDGLHALQFTQDEIDDILRTVSAILWLGNVEFEAQGETNCSIVDEEPVRRVAELLGSAPEMLTMALTSRTYEAGRRSSFVAKPLNADAARYTRDALAKAIYSRLFDWLVGRINAAIDPSQCMSEYELQDAVSIGVLDIYGFEIFEHNSFEQFCINYVNEKLQQVFIEYTLKSEQEEYERENIEWEPIQFFNNKVVCDLIEKKPVGIIALLDEACILPRGSDRSFLQKCVQHFDGHDHFQLPMDERARSMTRARARSRAFTTTTAEVSEEDTEFIIRHYAGDVTYEVEGFLDKNKDLVWKDLLRFGESADIGIFDHLFPKGCSVDMGNKRPVTAGTQFKRSVHSLMDTLHACTPHYIRCIKPNDQKKGGLYMENLSIHQIRYLGLLENVRVRRAGFTFRQEFGAFLARYKMLSPRTWPLWKGEPAEGVKAILTDKGITGADAYRLGKTKVFIREPTSLYTIEEARDERLHDLTTILSSNWRRYAQRKIYKRFRAVLKIQTRLRGVVQRRAYKRRSAALRIQAQIKRVLAVQRFRRLVSASVLQSHIRRAKARDLFRELIAAIKIQARYRGFATRVWYKQTRAAIRMQAQWRGYAQRTWYKRYCAARQIQRIARGNSARLYVLRLRSALRIQRIFRRWTAQKEFLRLRRQALDLLVGKRRRRRSVQRFFERIYLEEPVEQGVRAALPPDDNNVFFAARGSKVNRSGKSDQRILVLTHNAFHVLSEPKFKVHTSLPIEHISRVSVSTLPDSYFVLHSDATFDVLYCCHEKSELLTYISNLMQERVGQPLPVTVSDDVTFHIKKRKPRTVRFVPQEPPLVPVKPGQPAPELDAVAVKDKKAKDTFVVCVSTHVPFADDHAVESFRHGHVTIPLIRPSMLEDIDEED